MPETKIVARSNKPVLVIAQTVGEFDAWLNKEFAVRRTSSRMPVSAKVGSTEYIMATLNSRSSLGRQNFSRVIWVDCEDKAFDWFKDLVNSRVK